MSNQVQSQQIDEDLEETLFDVAVNTEGDVVYGEVTEIEKSRDSVLVSIRLPSGKTFTEWMDLPEKNSTEYKFVRVIEQAGYTLSSVEHLVGDRVPCEKEDDGWTVKIKTPRREVVGDFLGSVVGAIAPPLATLSVMVFWPVAGLPGLYYDRKGETDRKELSLEDVGGWVVISCLWAVFIALPVAIGLGP